MRNLLLFSVREDLVEKATEEISGDGIREPEEGHFFGYAALELIGSTRGTVYCTRFDKTYHSHELGPTTTGPGETLLQKKSTVRSV